MKFKVCLLFLIPVFIFSSSLFAQQQQEQLTITTYYPSPNGTYDELGANKLAVNVSGDLWGGVVAVPAEYEDMRNGDAHIGWSLIVGSGFNNSGFAYDQLQNVGGNDIRPGDGDVLIKGRVGIGTNQPGSRLHVYSADNPTVVRVHSSGAFGSGKIEFWSDPLGAANLWRPASIQSIDNGTFTGGLAFIVNGTGFANRTSEVEAMRIVNGRVGINTATPRRLLEVNGEIVAVNRLTLAQDATGAAPLTWHLDNSAGRFRIFDQPNIDTAGEEHLTITNTGNVGIGTITPQAKLDVVTPSGTNNGIRVGLDNVCNTNKAGTLRYNGVIEFCDGSNWKSIGTPQFQIVTVPVTGWSGTPPNVIAQCPVNYTLIGGTCDWNDWDGQWGDARSYPEGNSWRCKSWDGTRAARAFAFCAK